MTESDFDFDVSRRRLLAAAGLGGAALAAFPSASAAASVAGPTDPTAPPVAGVHLQFGADASSQMAVSWHTLQPVQRPRVLLGRLDGRLERTTPAATTSYVDAKSGKTVYAHHARIDRLAADTSYIYAALHDGAEPRFSVFR